jgi:hypothetical protein
MLGVAAATALPSEIFPFRKIFLPPAPQLWAGTSIERALPDSIFTDSPYEYILHPEQAKVFRELYNPLIPLDEMPDARFARYLGLSRSNYPGHLSAAKSSKLLLRAGILS